MAYNRLITGCTEGAYNRLGCAEAAYNPVGCAELQLSYKYKMTLIYILIIVTLV
jgi:hypothetical protein